MDVCTYEVFTLSGSTKFKKYFEVVARQLELSGHVVLWPGVYSQSDNVPAELLTELTINNLKKAHSYKIDMCNCLYIINPDGYIGDGTKDEIAYAIKNHKPIMYLESEDEMNQIFNSMTGIEDAVEEMHVNEEKAKYFASHPDVMVDACSCINPYGEVIENLKEIQSVMKDAQEVIGNMAEDTNMEEPEEDDDEISIIDELDGLKIMLGGIIIIGALIIGIGVYSCSLIGEINAKYNSTNEKLVELDEKLDYISNITSATVDYTDDDVRTISRNVDKISTDLENTNNILTLIDRKVYQEWPN